MKGKLIAAVLAGMVCLFASGVVFADETKVTVAIKGWLNTWEEKSDTSGETWDLGSALMIGPAINVRFSNNVFLGGSYMASTGDYETNDVIFIGDMISTDRQDLDLYVGYMFNPYFGAFLGYKSIEGDMKYTFLPFFDNEKFGSQSVTGPGIGILGSYPLNDTLAIYGNLALMSMDWELSYADGTPADTDDVTGASIEVGLALAFSQNFSGTIGYKSQSFSGDYYTDTFSGFTFGAAYTF